MQCQDVPCLPLPFLQYFNFTIPAEQKLSAAASGAALSSSEWLFSLLQADSGIGKAGATGLGFWEVLSWFMPMF